MMVLSLTLCLSYWILGACSFDVLREYKGNTFFNDANGKPKCNYHPITVHSVCLKIAMKGTGSERGTT
jgi:hypothetical protein